MTTNEFEAQKKELGIEGTGVDVTTTKDREWKDKASGTVVFTIPAGSQVHVDFSPKTFPSRIWVTFNGEVKISRTINAHNWMTGFRKPPTLKTLENRAWNGISKSVTGKKVEADGYGPDGSPAWEFVLGII